jgi:hypothetical protein
MVTSQSLKSLFDEKASQIEAVVAGMSEEHARQAPAAGEWCVREVLYHLSGDAGQTFYDDVRRFLEEDKPELPLTPGEVYTSPERESASLQELAASVADQYRKIGEFASGLSDEQLGRIARVGFLKQARGNDEVALSEWLSLTANYHLNLHIGQLQALTK